MLSTDIYQSTRRFEPCYQDRERPEPSYEKIPDEFRNQGNWVGWKYEQGSNVRIPVEVGHQFRRVVGH
jgi:hypothetical protein